MCKEIREKFQELYSLNVNEYVEKKDELSYLSWSFAWAEFKKIYPDATYEVKKDADGRCYFGDENIGYMVYTTVTAGGLSYEMWLPVMDGANKAMKAAAYTYTVKNKNFKFATLNKADGKYYDKYGNEQTEYITKTVEAMTMFDVNKAVMRCLVKNLAMFGLGLYIYAGEDLPEDIKEYVCADCGAAVDSAMAARTQKAFNVVLCKDCGVKRSEKK
jgi:DNA-directed RNA polymerase subunit RPC12/RpoP